MRRRLLPWIEAASKTTAETGQGLGQPEQSPGNTAHEPHQQSNPNPAAAPSHQEPNQPMDNQVETPHGLAPGSEPQPAAAPPSEPEHTVPPADEQQVTTNQPSEAPQEPSQAENLLPQQDASQVVTRRSQFRAKQSAKEGKKEKKAAKAIEKENKKKQKLEKAQAKAAKQQEIAERKRLKSEKKDKTTKRKAQEKVEKQKMKRTKGASKTSLKSTPKKRRAISKSAEDKAAVINAEADQATQPCTASHAKLPCSPERKRLKKSKRSSLRKMQNQYRKKKFSTGKPCKALQASAGSATPAKRSQDGKAKGKKKCKQVPPLDEYVKEVTHVLKDCTESQCTHPTWQHLSYDKQTFQISVYWSRCAVGVKVPKKQKVTQKGKGKTKAKAQNMTQVAYFGCPTFCVYSNMALAYAFVMPSVVTPV